MKRFSFGIKLWVSLSLFLTFGTLTVFSQTVKAADANYEKGIELCRGDFYQPGEGPDYPPSVGKGNDKDTGWRGCAQGYLLEKKYGKNMDAGKCTADKDELAAPPQHTDEYLDGCKIGVGLADGSKNTKNVDTNSKPENYNSAPQNIKAAAVEKCKDLKDSEGVAIGDGNTNGRIALSCWEGYVKGVTNQSSPCNDSGISDKVACTAGYNSGKYSGGTLANSVAEGTRLMKEFERDCSTKAKYTSNESRCRKIRIAMGPLCGDVANRETDTLRNWITQCKQKVQDAQPASSTTADDDTDSNCSGGSMGWLFCPMIEYMANTINAIAGIIDSLMEVRFMTAEGPAAQIEKGWRTFLSFANIMLVIAFLVIIFSQATQAGLSNYNVKRMLPRLVVAAILMNISFYICALLIDISNIVGASVMGLFVGDGSISSSIGELTNDGGFWGKAGAVIGGAALIGILVFVLPFVLLSIISVFVMLIGRQVILMCLVLVSSLAFVAWLLPNTEQYFQRWLKLFGQLLVVYPMVMLVFGASLYLSNLLGGEGGTGIVDDSMTGSDILRKLVQLIILMIPIFALPGLLKGSSSVIGRIGGVADRVGKDLRVEKVGDAVKGGATGAMKRGALNTEAAMASRGGRMGRIGNYRANRKFRQGERDKIRERIQEDAIHERYFGDDKKASDARNKLAGRLGGSAASERIKMNMDKLDLKRQLEDMEPVKLKAEAINLRIKQEQQRLSGVDMAGKLAHAESSLDAAMVSGNEESIKVWSGVAQGFGAPGRELLTNTATANVGTASAQHLADSLDYDAFQTSAPGMTEFISSAGADAPNSKGADSYGKVTVENIGKLDVSSLTTALSTYDAAGAPAISDTMVKDSLRVVNRDNLTQEHRSKLEAAATARGISFTP